MNFVDDVLRGLLVEVIIISNCWIKGLEFFWLFEGKWFQMFVVIEEEIEQKFLEEVVVIFVIRSCFLDYDVVEVFK